MSTVATSKKYSNPNCFPVCGDELGNINPEKLNFNNILYSKYKVKMEDFLWRWLPEISDKPLYELLFLVNGKDVRLYIYQDFLGIDTPINWKDYNDFSERLAWTVIYESFVKFLENLFGFEFSLTDIIQSNFKNKNTGNEILGFSFSCSNGGKDIVGDLSASYDLMNKVINRYKSNSLKIVKDFNKFKNIDIYGNLVIDQFETTYKEIEELSKGSVIRLDNLSLASEKKLFSVDLASQKILVENRCRSIIVVNLCYENYFQLDLNKKEKGDKAMFETESIEAGKQEKSCAILSDNLEVNLRFEAGQLKIPLSDLQDVQPGYVFELDKKLEDRMIVIYANDTEIAKGQLVCVGSLVGVRITEMQH